VEDIVATLGPDRQIVIAREVTKIHEEFVRGRSGEVLEILNARGDIKGEITLLIGKEEEGQQKAATGVSVRQRLEQIMAEEKLDEKAALKRIAKEMGISKSEAYRELQRRR
jgi:16S rRNA (cytidine1402-2'-O)-methyltransferase